MSRWQKVQCLPHDSLALIYKNGGFPIIVRHVFSQWIDEQDWFSLDENDDKYDVIANEVLKTLLHKMHEKIAESNEFITRMQLQSYIMQFTKMYSHEPRNLLRVIKMCLAQEQQLLNEADIFSKVCTNGGASLQPQNTTQLILHKINFTQQLTQETEYAVKVLQQKQESFIIQHQHNTQLEAKIKLCTAHLYNPEKQKLKQELSVEKIKLEDQLKIMARDIMQLRTSAVQKFDQTVQQISELMTKVLDDELRRWKRNQRLTSNGSVCDNNLTSIQDWCESLAEVIWQNRQQIKQLDRLITQLPIHNDPPFVARVREHDASVSRHLSCLIKNTFIVETQPPQVLKKDSRFAASVRLLVGSKLNVHMNPPQVKVAIINDVQSRTIMSHNVVGQLETSGEILNNTGPMEYDHTTNQLSINFRNMIVKKIKRAERKGSESVTEEKFCLLFHSEFNLGSGELVFQVRTISLPVVVTVHGNQECSAQATILWDNMFAEENRNLFDVPESVPWVMLADLLSMKFKMATDRPLSVENINYLRSKLLGADENQQMVTWSQFNKEQLQNRSFTFWDWFYGVLKLTKDHLKGPWRDGSIIGFISKDHAQEYLMGQPNGTFLLRFSDSVISGVTIAYIGDDPKVPGRRIMNNLEPYTLKDVTIRGIADRIKDLHDLVFLYPDVHKNIAFSLYYTSDPERPKAPFGSQEYIKRLLKETIPSNDDSNANYDIQIKTQVMSPSPPMYDSRPSSVHTVYDWTPPPTVANNIYSSPVQTQMDIVPDPHADIDSLMAMNDYDPDNISFINVNDILSN